MTVHACMHAHSHSHIHTPFTHARTQVIDVLAYLKDELHSAILDHVRTEIVRKFDEQKTKVKGACVQALACVEKRLWVRPPVCMAQHASTCRYCGAHVSSHCSVCQYVGGYMCVPQVPPYPCDRTEAPSLVCLRTCFAACVLIAPVRVCA